MKQLGIFVHRVAAIFIAVGGKIGAGEIFTPREMLF